MKSVNFLEGPILKSITKLALPIVATSFINMAYNLTDLFWVGKLGANYIAAVGTVGIIVWFSTGFMLLPRTGGQIKIAQYMGAKKEAIAQKYITSSIQLGIFFGILSAFIAIFFAPTIISFFKFNEETTINNAITYFRIVGLGLTFLYLAGILTGITTALGNGTISFYSTSLGLITNMILDPLLIHCLNMGIKGAAIATVTSQFIVILSFIYCLRNTHFFSNLGLFKVFNFNNIKEITILGLPYALQTMFFSVIAMFIGRIVVQFGDSAVAAQRLGVQIESIAWMTSESFAVIITSFMAQNYGARNFARAKKVYIISLGLMTCIGIISTIILTLFPEFIFRAFTSDINTITTGISYLKIAGYTQVLLCIEIMCLACCYGFGVTYIPTLITIILNISRIPLSKMFISMGSGLDGVWWSLNITTAIKAVILFIYFSVIIKKKLWNNEENIEQLT